MRAADKQQQHEPAAERRGSWHSARATMRRTGLLRYCSTMPIELAAVLQPIERDAQRRDDVLAPGQHGELIRPRDQRHFDRVVGQRAHQEAHRQVIAGDAVDLAALERADFVLARRDHGQRRAPRFRQGREQLVVDRVLVDGDAHAPQIVEAVRISRQARPHHHDLRERPGLIEQLIAGRALLRVRQEHDVGLAGVEIRACARRAGRGGLRSTCRPRARARGSGGC